MTLLKFLQAYQNYWIGLLYLIACICYIRLYYYMPFSFDWNKIHDDQFFLKLAYDFTEGRWLGKYSQFTLMKGPGYAFFLAFVHVSKLPLYLVTAVFHCISLTSLCWVLYRLSHSKLLSCGLFVVLLSVPLFTSNSVIIRDQIYPDQLMLGLALYLYALLLLNSARRTIISGLLCGIVLCWFWLTREEGMWIIPGMFLLLAYRFLIFWRESKHRKSIWQALGAIILSFSISYGSFQTMNWLVYDKFIGLDIKEKNFKAALAALQSVREGEPISHVPVPNKVLNRLYEISPTFGILKNYFTTIGTIWFEPTCNMYPGVCNEYLGGAFIWVLRDAAGSMGYFENPNLAAAFFAKIAEEVNSACQEGRLTCQKSLNSFMPAVADQDLEEIPQTLSTLINIVLLKIDIVSALTQYSSFIAPTGLDSKIIDYLNSQDRFVDTQQTILYGSYQFLVDIILPLDIKIINSQGMIFPLSYYLSTTPKQHFTLMTSCIEQCRLILTPYGQKSLEFPLDTIKGRSTTANHLQIYFDRVESLRSLIGNYDSNSDLTFKTRMFLFKSYQFLAPYLIGIALFCYAGVLIYSMLTRKFVTLTVVTGAIWLLILSRLVILFLIHISSFPALIMQYVMPIYSLILMTSLLSVFLFVKLLSAVKVEHKIT